MDASELFRLDGRVALVTGGAQGLGKDIALTFAQSGASLVIVDLVAAEETVRKAIEKLNERKRASPKFIDEKKGLEVFEKISSEYEKQIHLIAEQINEFSVYIPKRRKRKF